MPCFTMIIRSLLPILTLLVRSANGAIVPVPECSLLADTPEAGAAPVAGSAQQPPSHITTPSSSSSTASSLAVVTSSVKYPSSFATTTHTSPTITITAQVMSFAINQTIPTATHSSSILPPPALPTLPFTISTSPSPKNNAQAIPLPSLAAANTANTTTTTLPTPHPNVFGANPNLNATALWRYLTITLHLDGLAIEVPLLAELEAYVDDGMAFVEDKMGPRRYDKGWGPDDVGGVGMVGDVISTTTAAGGGHAGSGGGGDDGFEIVHGAGVRIKPSVRPIGARSLVGGDADRGRDGDENWGARGFGVDCCKCCFRRGKEKPCKEAYVHVV